MKEYSLGLYEKAMPKSCSWRQKLSFAKSVGFDFVEISIDETDERLARLDMTTQERQLFLHEFQETGIPIRTMCLSGHRKYPLGSCDTQIVAKSIEIFEKAVQLADDLGIRIIQLAGYDVYYEQSTKDTQQRFVDNLQKIVHIAASKSITLGLETMETKFLDTVGKAMQYVHAIPSPYLLVYPDVGNLTNAAVLYSTDICDDMRMGEGRIAAVHLKETLPGVFREVPFGSGHVNFPVVLQTAWELGIRKFVIEMWDIGNEYWQQDVKRTFQQMDALLQQISDK